MAKRQLPPDLTDLWVDDIINTLLKREVCVDVVELEWGRRWYMPKLKGIRITKESSGEFEIVPLFWAKRGGTQVASHMASKGGKFITVLADVIGKLVARADLKG